MQLLDIVALTKDLPSSNLRKGQVGTIVEIYEPDVFEVEFIDLEGRTYGLETRVANQVMQLYYAPLSQNAQGI